MLICIQACRCLILVGRIRSNVEIDQQLLGLELRALRGLGAIVDTAPVCIEDVQTMRANTADDVFICSASFEERCLGVVRRFKGYSQSCAYIFVYNTTDDRRKRNLSEMHRRLKKTGAIKKISADVGDPVDSVAELMRHLRKEKDVGLDRRITIDVTTFTKRHLFLLLRALDTAGLVERLRVLYTEPTDYVTDSSISMSSGFSGIEPIPSFSSTQSLGKPLMLVTFLGYESDRAIALFNNLDPNETFLFVSRPAYIAGREQRAMDMNRNLISLVGEEKIRWADARDPNDTYAKLNSLFDGDGSYALRKWSCCISPLGTKPQAIGLYLFWRENRGLFSVIYSSPLRYNNIFYSKGIGQTWQLNPQWHGPYSSD
jgi:hypothetical protein